MWDRMRWKGGCLIKVERVCVHICECVCVCVFGVGGGGVITSVTPAVW